MAFTVIGYRVTANPEFSASFFIPKYTQYKDHVSLSVKDLLLNGYKLIRLVIWI